MSNKKELFRGWTRDESLDHPAIIINPDYGTTIPQVVGFRTADGHPLEISLAKAEAWGLVEENSIRPLTLPVSEFLKLKIK